MPDNQRPVILPSGDMFSPPTDAPGIPAWGMLESLMRLNGAPSDAYRALVGQMKAAAHEVTHA